MKTVEELETVLNYQEEFLKNVQKKLEETKKELEELKKNKNTFEPTPKGWKPEVDELYYFVNDRIEVDSSRWEDDEIDHARLSWIRIFKTEEECQLYCDIQRAFRDASREFKYNNANFCLVYEMGNKALTVGAFYYNKSTALYFDDEETIQKLIDKFGEENVKRYYLGVYKYEKF